MTKWIVANIVVNTFVLFGISVHAQVEGLWEIRKVSVGDQIMTPVAKWTRINSDFTYQSRNGWLQNSEGNWTFDKQLSQFIPIEQNGIVDDFGPFEVEIIKDQMTWTRIEDGYKVVVQLERREKIPKGPADNIQCLWDLESAIRDKENLMTTYDPDNKRYYQIRWDRIFVDELGPEGRQTGYWHMNGHRPLLSLINHNGAKLTEQWEVDFFDTEMIWMGVSESNRGIKLTFGRMSRFPVN